MKVVVLIVIMMNILSFLIDKYSKMISVISLVLLSIVIYNAQKYADIINYERYFIGTLTKTYVSREIGFFYITKFVQLFTTDYNTYRTVLFCFGLLIMCCTAFRYGDNISLFLIAYASYFYFLDGIQIRNFLSISIVAYSMKWILQEEKESIFKYITGIVIASTIHSMFIIYALFILVKYDYINKLNGKDYKKVITELAVLLSVLMFIAFRYSSIIQVLIMSFGSNFADISERIAAYFSTSTHLGWVLPSVLYILNLVLLAYAKKALENDSAIITSRRLHYHKKTIILSEDILFDKSILDRLLFMNIIGLFFIPLCIVNLTFYRIGKNLALIDFTFFPQIYKYLSVVDRNKAILFMIGLIIAIIGWRFFDYRLYGSWDIIEQIYFSA